MSGSGPNSPASASIPWMEDDINGYTSNGLTLECTPFGLEKIYNYELGGHHPVHLGDRLGKGKDGDGRYCVVHKLGHGGFANVWLCRDLESQTPKYVAVKILMAEESKDNCRELLCVKKLKDMLDLDRDVGAKYICLPLAQFRIEGPNGSHLCFVYPVLGPRVSCVLKESEDPDRDLRTIALQAVQGMATLHSHGICHGDFTPSNILLRISHLDGLTEKQVIQALGEPKQSRVITYSGDSSTDPNAPKYLVYPVNFNKVESRFVTVEACIIDFGESFEASTPPKDLGIPQSYRSPELILDKVAGIASDLWALGCTLFEIRTGRRLFDTFDGDMNDHLFSIVMLLGRLPEPWWTTTWEARKVIFEDGVDSQGRAIKISSETPNQPEPRSIAETLASGLWYDMDFEDPLNEIHRDIQVDEIKVFADLLGKILTYNPSDRLTVDKVQDHEWFKI